MDRELENSDVMTAGRARGPTPALVIFALAMLASVPAQLSHAQPANDEYKVKAAFVFHFAQLVDWPSDAPGVPADSFNVCLLDDEPHKQEFQNILEGKLIGRRTTHIRLLNKSQSAENCRILFLSRNEGRRQAELLRAVRGLPVLTVGDADGFLTDGGMIRFHLDQDKIRFDISVGPAETSHLKISSRLLLLATSVLHSDGTGSGI